MKPKVLMVDDEKNILDAYARNLRDRFDITPAESGAAALTALEGATYPVIVTDYKMPGMNGVELLEQARDISPDTVQIMLTGQADMQAVVDLINKGRIFRFLTKPCAPEDLSRNIDDALRQYELVTAERELLGKTLGGSIRVLTDLLALAKPQAFHRAQRIRGLVKRILSSEKGESNWRIEIAAMLSQIGCVTIPDDILKKAFGGRMLTDYELIMFQNHPLIAADMIQNIPRMEAVADIIRYQEKNFDGTGVPEGGTKGEDIPRGARMLKIALDFDRLVNAGNEPENAVKELRKKEGLYDPGILEHAAKSLAQSSDARRSFIKKEVPVGGLAEGMYLAEDVVSAGGVILGSVNQKITKALIITLKNYEKNKQVKEIIKVLTISE